MKSNAPLHSSPEFQRVVRVFGATLVVLGAVVLIGWALSLPLLTSVSPTFHPMAQNTAVLFIIFGVILLEICRSKTVRRTRIELAVTAALISLYGLFVVLEATNNISVLLTNALLSPREFTGFRHANLMSPLSGVFFFVAGLSILPFLLSGTPNILWTFAGYSGAIILSGSFLITYGYLLGEPFLYGEFDDPMAFLTSIAFSLVGFSVMLLAGSSSLLEPLIGTDNRSRALRLFIPLAIVTCFVQGAVHHWFSATDLNKFLIYTLVPAGAALAAALASGKMSKFLSAQLETSAAQVAASQSMYQSAIENFHDLYWTLDTSGQFTYVNRRAAEVTGHKVEDWIGNNFAPLVHPEDLQDVIGRFHGALSGKPQEYELKVLGSGGRIVFLEVTTLPEYEAGRIVRVASYGKDITERRASELELRKSAETLRESQRIARLGSYDLDIRSGRWTNSGQLDEVFGIGVDFDRTPVGWLTLIHPEWRDMMQRHLFEDVFQSRQQFNKEYKIVRQSDGVERWVHGLGNLEFDESGAPVRMVGTIQDITERKALEQEREALSAQLRQAQKLETIGTLAGGVAHDFNNILTPIMVYSEMAALGLEEKHPSRQDIEHVIAGAHRAKDLVKQILTFSRQGENERIPMDMSPIVKEATKFLSASLPATISIGVSVSPNGAKVLADPSQIHQVLMNLCTNAYHAMRDKGGKMKVELTSAEFEQEFSVSTGTLPAGKYVCLSVTDTGCGMDERTRDRIFEPFFTTKPVGEGTGLGLSVVHGIIKNHDGGIDVTSTPDVGTCFKAYLPQIADNKASEPAVPARILGGGERILVVDDEQNIVNALRDVLEKAFGYSVTAFTDSDAALNHITDNISRYDLVIVDHTMPGKSGTDVATRLKELRPELPILLLTGYNQAGADDDMASGMFDRVVMKPLRASDIANVVRQTLDVRKV